MNLAICLALALATMFAVPDASAEPQEWQYELQERCVKRAIQGARPQLGADQAWAYERWVREGRAALVQEYLGQGPGGVIDDGRNITTYQNLYRAMIDYATHYSAYSTMLDHQNYYSAMLGTCFYLQIAPQH